MSNVAALLPIIRGEISKLRIPQAADKVYKDECVLSFDSPFSDTGLYVNMATYKGYGRDYLDLDVKNTGCKLYLHELWNQFEKTPDENAPQTAPSKLAIGVEGGFMGESQYEIVKEHFLVVVNGSNLESIRLPCSELPEYVSNVAQAIINHEGMKSNLQVQTWDADNERFVSRYADNLEQVNPEGKKIPQDPKQWRDEATGDTENLWLNLSTGYIGGGRKNWDGSGGSGSALAHYEATGRKYPLVVKLGTITPHGADIYSYAPEEDAMVLDPHLSDHLSFWGIDIMKLEKSSKTMSELEVALNMSYDWSKMMDGAEQLEPVTGPGLVGLRNIGSSCYLNSTMQTILAIPEVQERYLLQRDNIIVTAPADPTADFAVQLSKLAAGVLSDRYVPPAPPQSATSHTAEAAAASDAKAAKGADLVGEEAGKVANLEKYVVAPRMFKHLVGKGHPEFSSGRQQDVSEYFQYFLNVLSKAERVSLPRVVLPGAAKAVPTAALFEYHVEERFHCPTTNEVKYSPTGPGSLFNTLDLPVPMDKAVPYVSSGAAAASGAPPAQKRARVEGKDSEGDAKEYDMCVDSASSDGGHQAGAGATPTGAADQPELFVPFAACLEEFLKPSEVEMTSAAAGTRLPFHKSLRFQTFPRYLMVKMGRYYVGPNWVQVKITARIDVPEELDLTPYKARGPQPDEQLMAESNTSAAASTTAAAGTGTASAPFVISEELVEGLMQMGFSANGCRRAAVATRNADLETAMNWIIEHMEDPDFNDPPVLPEEPTATAASTTAAAAAAAAGGGATVDPEAMMMLTSMGYTETQVGAALKATDNNIERAADWLFSHAEDLDAAVAQVLSGSATGGSATGGSASSALPEDATAEGRYTLMAVISHMGKNTDHGHYICHIKKDGQWVLFNDEKVGKCAKPPLEHGFMYLYRRNDGPGTFAV